MIRSLIKIALLLVVGVLVYNFFLGTPAEKEQSRKIFNKGKDVIISVGDLVKSEKDKFDAGKYDNALDKVGDMFKGMKDKAQEFQDEEYVDKLNDLDDKRKELQDKLSDIEVDENNKFSSKTDERKARKIQIDIDGLLDKAKNLVEKMEEEAQ